MARSRPFLSGTILFSSISPDYERNLKEELWGCFKNVGISFDELLRMPTRDRKYYIQMHNRYVEEENAKLKGNNSSSVSENISSYTDLAQQNNKNLNNR